MQAGEGLYNIALAYTLTVDDLLSVNAGLTTASTLRIGQVGRWEGQKGCWLTRNHTEIPNSVVCDDVCTAAACLPFPLLPAGAAHPALAGGGVPVRCCGEQAALPG